MKNIFILLLIVSYVFANSEDRAIKRIFENESKIAMLIGNSQYIDNQFFDSLKNPENDVRAVAKKLKALGFRVIEGYNLSDLELQDKLSEFVALLKSNRDGVGLFYFAGHGIEVNGVNYLIPVDIKVSDVKYIPYKSSPLNPIIEMMNETGKRLNIAILDACRDNPFKSTRTNRVGGLATFSASGTFVVYSAESGKSASDGRGNLSPFAESLVKHIDTPQKIEELFNKVRSDVRKATNNEQTPATYNLVDGDFYFKLPVKFNPENVPDEVVSTKNKSSYSIEEVERTEFRLKIDRTPADSRVVVEGLSAKYSDGVFLTRGKYSLLIQKDGYIPKRIKIDLQSDLNLEIALEKIAEPVKQKVETENKTYVSKPINTKKKTSSSSSADWNKRIFKGERSYSKFSDNLVKDNFTNLVWTKNSSDNYMNWNSAKSYCEDLTVDGYSDFRLPTEKSYII